MKNLIGILFAAFLVMGMAGQAGAAFTLGDVQIVAYENSAKNVPMDPGGNEAHHDLGIDESTFMDLSVGNIPWFDTGIDLGNFSTGWDTIYVGVFGGGLAGPTPAPNYVPAVFSSAIPPDNPATPVSEGFVMGSQTSFGNNSVQVWNGLDQSGAATQVISKQDSGGVRTYFEAMNGNGAGATYGGLLTWTEPDQTQPFKFGPETALSAGLTEADPLVIPMYGINADGSDLGKIGEWAFAISATDDLRASYNAVPIPGAVWLLGSILLGVFGLKRKTRS
jgi:hypothetical protein